MSEDIEQIYKRTEQYGRMQFVEEIDKLQCEKQQLISFLEEKIKEYEKMYVDNDEPLIVLQEVLDFVKKGSKR